MRCPSACITRDGRFVIATGARDHADDPAAETRCAKDFPTYLFDREGHIVLTWPANGKQDAWVAAVLAKQGHG